MKIRLDRELCRGHAQCNARGPDVYELDDNGYATLTELEIPAGLEDQARAGVRACPEGAVTVLDD
jgi:ferredoxin